MEEDFFDDDDYDEDDEWAQDDSEAGREAYFIQKYVYTDEEGDDEEMAVCGRCEANEGVCMDCGLCRQCRGEEEPTDYFLWSGVCCDCEKIRSPV